MSSASEEPRLEPQGATAAPPMSVEVSRQGHEHVIRLSGELDLLTVRELEAAIDVAEAGDARAIVIDLSGLEFMDSTGLAAILAAERRSSANGSRMELIRGPEQVHRVFTLTKTEERLPFRDR